MNLIMGDPGHGGKATGAISSTGAMEKDINLSVSLELAQILMHTWADYTPVLTRYTDTALSLDERCKIANRVNPLCFVSIHCNSASTTQARGFEVFTTKGTTKADSLATKVFEEVQKGFPGMVLRSDFSDGDPDKEENFAVLRGTACPAILVECAFMSNEQEMAMLATKQFHTRMAAAIAYGITRWVVSERGRA